MAAGVSPQVPRSPGHVPAKAHAKVPPPPQLTLGAGLLGALIGGLMGSAIGLRYAIAFGAMLLLVAAGIIIMSEVEGASASEEPLSSSL